MARAGGDAANQLDVIKDIPDDVANAREYAILGAYDVSLQYYDRATSAVARFMRLLVDTADRNKWSKVKEDLSAEVKLIKEIIKEQSHFKHPPGRHAGSQDDGEDGSGGASRGGVGRRGGVVGPRGLAFGGRHDNEDDGDADAGDGRRRDDGTWSPPPLLDRGSAVNSGTGKGKARSVSVGGAGRGVEQSASAPDLQPPAWDGRKQQHPAGAAAGGGVASRPSASGGAQRKSILDGKGGVAAAAVGVAGGRPPGSGKAIMKAPLPPAAKRPGAQPTAAAGAAAGRGGKGAAVAAGPGRPSGSGGGGGTNVAPPSDGGQGGGDGTGGGGGVVKYSDLHRASPDFDLIDRLEREILDLAPNVRWGDIAGLEDAKGVLQEAVVLPMMCPGFFSGIRKPWKGVLLYGPPGTGKTLLAKAVATECRTTFFNVSASSLASKWRGDSEKLVRLLFEMAKHYAPTVLFFDEVDSIATRRSEGEHEASRRMKTEMLVCMDGISNSNEAAAAQSDAPAPSGDDDDAEGGDGDDGGKDKQIKMVMVLGATNQPWELDDAFKRRFEKRIYIPLPGPPERQSMFRICLRDIRMGDDVDLDRLANITENYSGADIAVVCKHAAYAPMRHKQAEVARLFPRADQIRDRIAAIQASETEVKTAPIAMVDFEDAIAANRPSASVSNLKKFEEYAVEHGAT